MYVWELLLFFAAQKYDLKASAWWRLFRVNAFFANESTSPVTRARFNKTARISWVARERGAEEGGVSVREKLQALALLPSFSPLSSPYHIQHNIKVYARAEYVVRSRQMEGYIKYNNRDIEISRKIHSGCAHYNLSTGPDKNRNYRKETFSWDLKVLPCPYDRPSQSPPRLFGLIT